MKLTHQMIAYILYKLGLDKPRHWRDLPQNVQPRNTTYRHPIPRLVMHGNRWRIGFLWDWKGYWIDDNQRYRNRTYFAIGRREGTQGMIFVCLWLYVSILFARRRTTTK